MAQQPKKGMVKGEMGGLYKKADMTAWRKGETKSLNDMKAYGAKYAKMTPAQKKAEDAGFKAAQIKLQAEFKRLNATKKK